MIALRSFVLRLGLVGLCLSPFASGCSAEEAPDGASAEVGDEDEVVPADATTLWDQSNVCSLVLKRHEVIRSSDYKDGVARWNCADVPGVGGGDLGQEYCEYHAVSGGKPVKSVSDAAPGAPIQCLFTSLYKDAFASASGITKYVNALGAKENLGVKPPVSLTGMQVGFNSRGAATALVVDCYSQASASNPTFDHDTGKFRDKTAAEKTDTQNNLTEELRQAACWQASVANPSKASALKTACRTPRGKLLNSTRWKKAESLGVKVLAAGQPGYDEQRTLAACLGSYRSGAVTWRNSDNIICERVTRAASECSCSYNMIPDEYVGFTFGTWSSATALPPGCRFAKVDGKDSQNLVICELSASQRSDLEVDDTYSGDLDKMCHDYFSKEIVMSAPIRGLQKAGSCQATAGFCASYSGK